ncbi:MAG: hypothetical protein DHS20C01_15080 [marine bacterium B5-7]|nr:MAG: hypothetical protein DHS20C01_15080 [marine bacterium B5-7]
MIEFKRLNPSRYMLFPHTVRGLVVERSVEENVGNTMQDGYTSVDHLSGDYRITDTSPALGAII